MSTFIDSMLRKIQEQKEKRAPKAVIHRIGCLILRELDCMFEDFLNHGVVNFTFSLEDSYYDPSDPERILTEQDAIRRFDFFTDWNGFCNIYDLQSNILEYLNELLKKLPFRVEVTWKKNEYDCSEFTIKKLD